MSEEAKYPDHVLLQLIESVYQPAPDWEHCSLPLTTDQIVKNLLQYFPGKFYDSNQVRELLKQLHIKYVFNEYNRKYYWLVNPAEFNLV